MSKKRRQQKQAEKRQVAASKQVVNKNKRVVKKAKKTNVVFGRLYILSTFNNTMITATDVNGNVVAQSSTGKAGFKGTKKSTPFAANQAAKMVMDKFEPLGMKKVEVFVKGVGPGRDAALRVLGHAGVEVASIRDVTPVPHNGARPRKARRV
jgi:small subunit ribosomal protein S11